MAVLNISRGFGCLLGVLVYYAFAIGIYVSTRDDWKHSGSGSDTIDAIYFATVSLTTIGYGDISPDSDVMKILVCLLLVYGLSIITYCLSVVVELVVERQKKFQSDLLLASAKDLDILHAKDQTIFGPRATKIWRGTTLLLSQVAIGTILFSVEEDATFVDSVYFAVVSCTTVGYGDYSPTTQTSRIVSAIWLIVATVATAYALENLTDGVLNLEGKAIQERRRKLREKIPQDIFNMVNETTHSVDNTQLDEVEFVIGKLFQMSALEEDIIKLVGPLRKRFRDVDKDNSGKVSVKEIEDYTIQVDLGTLRTQTPPPLGETPLPLEKAPSHQVAPAKLEETDSAGGGTGWLPPVRGGAAGNRVAPVDNPSVEEDVSIVDVEK